MWSSSMILSVFLTLFVIQNTQVYAMSDDEINHKFCTVAIKCDGSNQFDDMTSTQYSVTSSGCKAPTNCTCKETKNPHGKSINCSGAGLKKIPHNLPKNLVALHLRNNSINVIDDNIFENYTSMVFLDLSENNLTQLNRNSFTGLQHLTTLLLNWNRITYCPENIHKETFAPLKNLNNLQLQNNSVIDNQYYPDEALAHLPNLHCLSIDGLKNKFPLQKSFTSLRWLLLDGYEGRCSINSLKNGMIKALPNLTHLTLRYCNLTAVEDDIFVGLKKLQQLDLSYNEDLQFHSMPNISKSLIKTNISSLCLNKIHTTFGGCTELTAENLQHLNKTSIRYLSLNSNRLSILAEDAVVFIPQTFIGISLNDNQFLAGNYIIQVFLHIKFFKHLEIIDFSRQHINHDFRKIFKVSEVKGLSKNRRKRHYKDTIRSSVSTWSDHTISSDQTQYKHDKSLKLIASTSPLPNCSNCDETRNDSSILRVILPPNLKLLDLSDIRVRIKFLGYCVCQPNNLKTIKLNRNIFWELVGPITGVSHLEEVDLSWNSCIKLSSKIFHNMQNLIKLDLSRNLLGFPLSKDDGETFSQQSQLRFLNLYENKLRFMPTNIFKGLVNLNTLILAKNQLTDIWFSVAHMKNLSHLDVSDNYLTSVKESARKHFDTLGMNFSIDLSTNKFTCDCKNQDFVKWISESKVVFLNKGKYKCKFENGSYANLSNAEDIYRILQKECTSHLYLILGTSGAILLSICIVIAGLLYRYRWDLRYMYYSAKLRSKGFIPLNAEHGEYEHDVFVSYAEREGRFVRRVIVPELEEKRGVRLLVHDRDFRPGEFVSDNIMQAITECRKTLVVMSKNFLKSNWCLFEMNMARMEAIKTGRNVLCVLKMEEVSYSGLKLEVIDIIEEKTYARVPDNPQEQTQFWDQLKDSLMN